MYQVIVNIVEPFVRNGRIINPTLENYKQAGSLLSDLGWPTSKKSNNVLITFCARKIGAEIWTCDYSDFKPIADALHGTLRKIT